MGLSRQRGCWGLSGGTSHLWGAAAPLCSCRRAEGPGCELEGQKGKLSWLFKGFALVTEHEVPQWRPLPGSPKKILWFKKSSDFFWGIDLQAWRRLFPGASVGVGEKPPGESIRGNRPRVRLL